MLPNESTPPAPQDDTPGPKRRWVVIAEEPDQLSAEMVLTYLRRAAVPARLAGGDTMSFLGPSLRPTRVLVPEEWADEAAIALERRGMDDGLPPGVQL